MAVYLLLAHHQVPGTALSIMALGQAVRGKVAVRALEAVRTQGRGTNRTVLLGGQGTVSAESGQMEPGTRTRKNRFM